MKATFHTHGKLLLTAEYAVLDGAKALALPTKVGQTLEVFQQYTRSEAIHWRSLTINGDCWFEGSFNPSTFKTIHTSDKNISTQLEKILTAIDKQNPGFVHSQKGTLIQTLLAFPRLWGLGTSSTLIAALAQWSQVDPYQLLTDTFGGSGYDLACAVAQGPILYQREDGQAISNAVDFCPSFSNQLYFIYLGKKQNSREGIQRYREKVAQQKELVEATSQITESLLTGVTWDAFNNLIEQHESLIANVLELPKVKDQYFSDYWGSIKSLGAWGGDFVLATSDQAETKTRQYFHDKGFDTFLRYSDLIL